MNVTNFIDFSFTDTVDILLVALLMYSLYRLVKGTVAINIFIGIVIIYLIWRLTDLLKMDILSNLLGKFISVGFFALIVVFQEEIRKFLLLIGSSNFTNRRNIIRYFRFHNQVKIESDLNFDVLLESCKEMATQKTGAIIVLQRNNVLDFLINKENQTDMTLSPQLLQTIFFKNSPLHDGAVLMKKNKIMATRVVLPVSESRQISSKYGLRHRAALGITEKTDAVVIVISEQTGKITYVKNSELETLKNVDQLKNLLQHDLSF
ncbi:MAG: diadenylate cyclase CdaA [Flavobacteriaceae bacterium]